MNFILDEKEFAQICIQHNTYEKNDIRRTLELMAQYYYQYCGFRKVKITTLLLEFLEKGYSRYSQNKRQWEITCEQIARCTGGKPLLEIKGVWLTDKELETMRGIQNKTLARLAFTMACIAKINNARNAKNNGWLNLSSKDIFDAAHISGTRKQRDLRIADMLELGLIEIPKKTDKVNIRVTFLDDNSEKALFVSDFRELGLFYQKEILQEKRLHINKCQDCGKYYIPQKDKSINDPEFKHCPACMEERNKIKPPLLVQKMCCDCGTSFYVDARANKKIRCSDCQKEYKKLKDRLRKQKRMEFSAIENAI